MLEYTNMKTLTHEYTEKVENLLSSSNLGEKQQRPVDTKKFCKSYTYIINFCYVQMQKVV